MRSLRTIADIVAGFEPHRNRPAILWQQDGKLRSLSYGEVHDTALRLARGLRDRGLVRGDTVALVAGNCPEWLLAYLGIVLSGATVVPLDPLLPAQTLLELIDRGGCRLVFTDAAQLLKLRASSAADAVEFLLLDADAVKEPAAPDWATLLAAAPGDPALCQPRDIAALLYTSGTTGQPKGVPLSHRNICSNVEALAAEGLVSADDRVLLPLPMHHAYPCTTGCLGALAYGAAIVIPAGLTGAELTSALRRGRASVLLAVPRLLSGLAAGIEAKATAGGWVAATGFRAALRLSRWMRQSLGLRVGRLLFRRLHGEIGPDLRILASGGAALEVDLAETLEALGWEVLSGYGLTETAPILTFNRRGRARFGSVGQALPGIELRLADAGGRGFGEVEARGPNVFSGYRDLPEETARAMTADGWFRTGDLGRIDESGYLYIVGRAKEMIVLPDGKNIFPAAIEEVFETSLLMKEAAVLQRGAGLALLIVADESVLREHGAVRLSALLHDEIEILSLGLPPYQRVAGFAVTRQALPRTTLGKLKRHELAEIYDRALGATAPPEQTAASLPDDPALATLPARAFWQWLRGKFPDKVLTLEASPQLDLGIDSLGWVELTMEIEERFGARLTETEVSRILSLRDLVAAVTGATGVARAARGFEGMAEQAKAELPAPLGPIRLAVGFCLYLLNAALFRGLFRLRVTGLENLPAEGACLLAPNHRSYLDPLAVAAALPWRRLPRTYWAGWTGILFAGPLSRWFSRTANVLPVDPDRRPAQALALATRALARGHSLVWFPEGRISRNGALQAFLPGIGVIVENAGAQVVPVWIEGTFAAWPATRSWPRLGRISVTFGAPVVVAARPREAQTTETAAKIAAMLHDRVAALEPAGSDPR